VRGEHKGWPLDPDHPAGGSHEEGFKKGDKQRLLWQIYDCAKTGTTIPEWAAMAFCDALYEIVTCRKTWDQAFGEVPAKRRLNRRGQYYKPTIQKLDEYINRVGEAVQNYDGPWSDVMWDTLEERFGLTRPVLKDCWSRYKSAHRKIV
jgi:hypothetical protein